VAALALRRNDSGGWLADIRSIGSIDANGRGSGYATQKHKEHHPGQNERRGIVVCSHLANTLVLLPGSLGHVRMATDENCVSIHE
jgi:hypothetical protein